ncbi:unknown [Firmicutes bacterium CAG:884]|nr:unknown [Firmicutes bacterium CAG:884]
MISNYNFEGIINGFILDETLIDCNNVICDVNSQILTISKKMYNKLGYDKSIKELDEYERFELLLNAYLLSKPGYIVFKNMFCDFSFENIKKLKLLFRDLKKRKVCKFIICTKNLDLIMDLCDYVVTDDKCGKPVDVFKNKKGDLPFCSKFVRELEEIKGKKFGIYHNNISDLAKDVYRYVR